MTTTLCNMAKATKALSEKYGVMKEELEFIGPWKFEKINLLLFNIIKKGHEKHGSTISFDLD